MSDCRGCGFWDFDCEACTCPSWEMWYACPIESERPENKKALEEWIKELREGGEINLSRIEETNAMIEAIKANNKELLIFKSISSDKTRNIMLNEIATVLADIALSLAIICDKYNKEAENEKDTDII